VDERIIAAPAAVAATPSPARDAAAATVAGVRTPVGGTSGPAPAAGVDDAAGSSVHSGNAGAGRCAEYYARTGSWAPTRQKKEEHRLLQIIGPL